MGSGRVFTGGVRIDLLCERLTEEQGEAGTGSITTGVIQFDLVHKRLGNREKL